MDGFEMNKLKFLALAACVAAGAAWAVPTTEGEVKKIDKETQKITLRHGEIKNLGMPGMMMVFNVKDPAMLDQVQPGDKVRFTAEKIGGAIVVTEIEVAR
jgi:Cu(I)/Ag(I) efflux system periplasmic protein CusF